MQTIMVATDFSERSDRALRRASLLAKQFKTKVVIVHVVDDDQPAYLIDGNAKEAQGLLRALADTMESLDGIVTECRVLVSNPFSGIVQAAADIGPDLMVVGPHRRQVLKDAFVGTTAERVIRSVGCPVLMTNAPPVASYRHILQTTDLSDASGAAIRHVAGMEIGQPAYNSVLYVYDVPALHLVRFDTPTKEEREYYQMEQRKEAARELSQFLTAHGASDVELVLRYQESTVPHQILTGAGEEKADLIVISTRGRGGLAKVLLGSVAEQVLAKSTVDVLVIPPCRD